MADGDTHRFYAVLLVIAGAACFGYALGRQTGDAEATERMDLRMRQTTKLVVEQTAKLEAAGAFGAPVADGRAAEDGTAGGNALARAGARPGDEKR